MATVAELLVVIGADVDGVKDGVDEVRDRLDQLEKKNSQGGGFSVLENIAVGALHRIGEVGTNLIGSVLSRVWDFAAGGLAAAGDYEQAMNRIQAITGATDASMAQLDATAVRLGETFGAASAKDAADALEVLTSRGMTAAQANAAVEGSLQLATAAQIAYTDAAKITSNILDAYKMSAAESAKITDVLAATSVSSGASITDLGMAFQQVGAVANAFGLSAEETAAALGMMSKAGIEGSDAGTSLKSMLLALQNPSDKARELMEQYGVSIYNADGSIKNLNQIIEEFNKIQVGAQVTIRASADELDKYQKQADSTQKKIESLGESNATIARQMQQDQEQLAKFAEDHSIRRQQAEQDYLDKITSLNADAVTKRTDIANDLAQRITTIEQSHAEKLEQIAQGGTDKRANIEREYGDKVADINTAYNTKLEEIARSFADRGATAATDYHSKLQQLEADHQGKLDQIATQAAQKREDLQRNLGEKLADIETSYRNKLADIAATYEAKGQEAAEKYQSQLESLEAAHISKMADIRAKAAELEARYQQQQINDQADYQYKLLDMQRDFEAKQRNLADSFAASQLDRQLGHEEKVADIQDEYGDKITDLQEQLAKTRRRSEREALEKQIAEAIAARDKALAEEDEDYKRAQEQAQRRYDLQLKQAQEAYARQLAEADEKRRIEEQRDKEAYERQRLALEAQLSAETTAYEQRRIAAQEAYQAQLADIATAQAEALAQEATNRQRQEEAARLAYERQLADLQIATQRQTQAEQEAYTARQQQADAAYTETQRKLEEQRQQALVDAQADQQARLTDAATANERQLADLDVALQRQREAEQASYEKARQQATAANAQKLADVQANLDQQLGKLDDGYTKQEQRANAAYQRSFTDLQTSVNERSAQMQAEMAENNAAITEQQGVLNGLNHTLETQGERLVTVTQQMRDSATGAIFGSDGVRAYNTVVATGLPLYQEMANKVEAQGKASVLADAQLKGLNGATAEATSAWETLQLELGKEAIPTATEAVRLFTQFVRDHGPEIKAFTRNTIIPLANKALELAKEFSGAGDKLQYIKDKINENKQPIIDAVVGIVIGTSRAIGENAPKIAQGFIDGMKSNNIGMEIGKGIMQGMYKGMSDEHKFVNDTMLNIFTVGLWTPLKAWWGIHSPSTKMAEIGSDLVAGMQQGLINKSGEIYNQMTEIGMRSKDKLAEWRGAFEGVGDNLIQGIRSGMERAWGGLQSFINQNASQLPEWFKSYFGIHSPSQLMADEIGRFIPEGIAVGITANADSVQRAVENLTGMAIEPSISANVAPSLLGSQPSYAAVGGTQGAAAAPITPITINVYPQGNVIASRDLVSDIYKGLSELGVRNGGLDLKIRSQQ